MIFNYLFVIIFVFVMILIYVLNFILLMQSPILNLIFVECNSIILKPFHFYLHLMLFWYIVHVYLLINYLFVSHCLIFLSNLLFKVVIDHFFLIINLFIFVILSFIDLLNQVNSLNFDFVKMQHCIFFKNLQLLII